MDYNDDDGEMSGPILAIGAAYHFKNTPADISIGYRQQFYKYSSSDSEMSFSGLTVGFSYTF